MLLKIINQRLLSIEGRFYWHLPVEHHHYFEKTKGFLIGGIGLLIVTAITVGLSFGLYRENTRMKKMISSTG
jgi:hypothetical protein